MCGEQSVSDMAPSRSSGSSPRVRGADRAAEVHSDEDGIIPACAGSSRPRTRSGQRTWDHPRVCGEQTVVVPLLSVVTGSSPRVRGAVGRIRPVERGIGIIPACAGSSSSAGGADSARGDHPRVCGEQAQSELSSSSCSGSSPRVRGAVST